MTLKRSARDNTLVTVADEKQEALQQSVTMLFKNQTGNNDFLSVKKFPNFVWAWKIKMSQKRGVHMSGWIF